MVYDFSELTEKQKKRLEKLVHDALLEIDNEDLVNLYSCILADGKNYLHIYDNNEAEINKQLQGKNIWKILRNYEKGRSYDTSDDWFVFYNNTLYSSDYPERILGNLPEAIHAMAKLLVENYADDFNIAELADVMRQYTAEDEEED